MTHKTIKYFLLGMFSTLMHVAYAFHPTDSIGVEEINGQAFILHRVEAKETLYALSKLYEVQITDIEQFNPTVKAGLKIDQVLKIPTFAEAKTNFHIVKASETLYAIAKKYGVKSKQLKKWNGLKNNKLKVGQKLYLEPAPDNAEVEVETSFVKLEDGKKIHEVEASETLYAISKMYGISVDDLKKWNQLSANEVKIGQKLIVGLKEEPKERVTTTLPDPIDQADRPTYQNKNVEEKGQALVIESSGDTKKYLALHRTAPVGTIIQVINDTNNLSVFVRVVGKIPDNGVDKNIIIKISNAAFEGLGGVNKKFAVKLKYVI